MVKRRKMGMSLILGSAIMVAGPVMAGCSTGVSADEWAATEGAIGRINMEAVQEAFEKSKSVGIRKAPERDLLRRRYRVDPG